MKKKVRLTILMLAGVLAYFASEKTSAAGWCNEWCDLYDGQYCCIAPDCSLVCY
jgi:hypothetical protein